MNHSAERFDVSRLAEAAFGATLRFNVDFEAIIDTNKPARLLDPFYTAGGLLVLKDLHAIRSHHVANHGIG